MITRTNHALLTAALLAVSTGLLTAQDQKADPQNPTVEALIQQLGDDSFQLRREAEQGLRRQGKAALDALRAAAGSHDDAEVQWRAKRLVKQIEDGDAPGLAPRGRQGLPGGVGADRFGQLWFGPGQDVGERFDSMFEQLERELGMPIPRAQFFGGDFFKNLEERMDEARRGWARESMGLPGAGGSFSMRVGNDGVRIEVTERGEDGKAQTKTYEAPDVETFRSKYPDIAERYLQRGGPARVFSFGGGNWPQLRLLGPDARGWTQLDPVPPPQPQVVAADANDRLGVLVEAVPEAVREFLSLPSLTGLRVQSVVAGSVAEKAGVQDGDILLEVAGRAVSAPEDVRDALGSVESGAGFEIKVNRRGSEQTLSGTRPAVRSEEAEPRKLEKRDGSASDGKRTVR